MRIGIMPQLPVIRHLRIVFCTLPPAASSYPDGDSVTPMVTAFNLPGKADLVRIGKEERLNVFRRFFASSRYGRLIIQRYLVLSAAGEVPIAQITEMEKAHNQNFSDTFAAVREYGFLDEFLSAVKEEDAALQKIIEAYDRRMEGRV